MPSSQAQEVASINENSQGGKGEARTSLAPQVLFGALGVRNAREQLSDVQADLTYYSRTPKLYYERQRAMILNPRLPVNPTQKARIAQSPITDREVTAKSRFYYEAPNLFIEQQTDKKVASILRSSTVVIDANRAFLLDEYDRNEGQSKTPYDESGFYSFGYIRPANEILENGLVENFHLSDPRYYCYFDRLGGEPIDQRLLRPDFKAVYQGEEVINGSRCMKIEVSFLQDAKILYWIDVEHSFLLRRREERTYSGEDLLRDETVVPEVQESNGVWLPKTVEIREFLDPVKAKVGQSPEVDPAKVVFTRVTISDFKANTPIPADTFVMKWPKGTNVRNQITQTGFVADGEQTNQSDDKTDADRKAKVGAAKPDKFTNAQAK